jgi:hypothetical protein
VVLLVAASKAIVKVNAIAKQKGIYYQILRYGCTCFDMQLFLLSNHHVHVFNDGKDNSLMPFFVHVIAYSLLFFNKWTVHILIVAGPHLQPGSTVHSQQSSGWN